MEQVRYIEDVREARALLKPLRLEILRQLADPRTCNDLAETFSASPQRIYYHVKLLERSGLVEKIAERRVRGLKQGIYQATARSYWLSPQLSGQMPHARDEMSLGYLLSLAEQVHREVGSLTADERETPSLSVNAQVELADAQDRALFLEELQTALTRLAEKYGVRPSTDQSAELYRLIAASYPIRRNSHDQ